MFKRHLRSFAFLWLILVLTSVWILHKPSSSAKEAYKQLMDFSDQAKKEQSEEEIQVTQQTRLQVSKQILYKQDQHRLQSRLISESSELLLSQKGNRTELVERFKDLSFMMQEKIFYSLEREEMQPRQFLHHLKAQEAIYSYRTGQLDASQVEFIRYHLSGHLWPPSFEAATPLMGGNAQHLQLTLSEAPIFRAQGFQATFHDWGNE